MLLDNYFNARIILCTLIGYSNDFLNLYNKTRRFVCKKLIILKLEKEYGQLGRRRDSTQEVASEKCDITNSFYGNIERGTRKMSVETLAKISEGLGVSTDSLLFGNDSDKKNAIEDLLLDLQRNCDEEQFKKYLAVIKSISTIIDQL